MLGIIEVRRLTPAALSNCCKRLRPSNKELHFGHRADRKELTTESLHESLHRSEVPTFWTRKGTQNVLRCRRAHLPGRKQVRRRSSCGVPGGQRKDKKRRDGSVQVGVQEAALPGDGRGDHGLRLRPVVLRPGEKRGTLWGFRGCSESCIHAVMMFPPSGVDLKLLIVYLVYRGSKNLHINGVCFFPQKKPITTRCRTK